MKIPIQVEALQSWCRNRPTPSPSQTLCVQIHGLTVHCGFQIQRHTENERLIHLAYIFAHSGTVHQISTIPDYSIAVHCPKLSSQGTLSQAFQAQHTQAKSSIEGPRFA